MQTNDVAYANGVPGLRVEMTYDGQSRRVRKVEKSFSAQNNTWSVTSDTRYLYDGWNLIAELAVNQQSGVQNLKATHAWGLDLSGTETGAGGVGGLVFTALYSTTQTTANNSQPPPTSVLAPCYDGNGNVLAYCDAGTGQTLGRYEYDPFGRLLLREEDPRIAGRAAHLFSTKYLDAETGLSYYGFRYYSPELGRWINRDPIEERGGKNALGFVRNAPVCVWDVLGLNECECKTEDCDPKEIEEIARAMMQHALGAAGGTESGPSEIGGIVCCRGRTASASRLIDLGTPPASLKPVMDECTDRGGAVVATVHTHPNADPQILPETNWSQSTDGQLAVGLGVPSYMINSIHKMSVVHGCTGRETRLK